jgi:hypothetical protein
VEATQTDGADERIVLIYEESVRAIRQQQESLESSRTRAGYLLSAAAIASSLFGASALEDGTVSCLTWNALAAFVVVVTATLYVLWPREWTFSNNVGKLLAGWVDGEGSSVDTMRREIAEFHQSTWNRNQRQLGRLYVGFGLACAALGVEVVLWLIDLATS